MIRRRMFPLMLAFAVPCLPAQAYGPWLEKTPLGGVELGGAQALDRAALERGLAEIDRDLSDRTLAVRRAKALAFLFDHVRLAVNTNDLFVHWHADCGLLPQARERRVAAFARAAAKDDPRRHAGAWMADGGSFNCRLDTSHTCPDWASVLALGPKGLAERARVRRKTAKTDAEREFLDGVVEVYEALARECLRWAEFAASKGMRDVAASLREIAAHPPRTFREALQWSLVYDRAQEAEGEDVRSQGLFDRLFIRFYRDDLAAGRETRESAKRLIADYYTRLWSQQHSNGKNIGFGGYDAKGVSVWNELTELGFEVYREQGRINPKFTYRFGRKTPREQVAKVTRCLAEGKNSIVFACDDTLYESFRRRGKDPQDLSDYVLVGCYEPGIGGREIIASMAADVNLAKPLETVLARPEAALPRDAASFERAYFDELAQLLDRAMAAARATERHWGELHPAPLFSGAFRDCIASARDAYCGGCRYNSSGIVLVGFGTVVDALAAVRHLVDETKTCTLAELAAAVRADWKGHETLRLRARNAAPKWGNNDARADAFAKALYARATARVNAAENGHGGHFQAGVWSIYLDEHFGRETGATPDGRRRGETLSRNNVATAGCGREGPTALMLSNLKLDLAEAPDGHILDLLLPASLRTRPTAADDLSAVIATYFAKGGQCLHLNCFDASVLRDAMAHPEKYPDLQVRVCGWNVRWADLTPVEKRHFLATAEAAESSSVASCGITEAVGGTAKSADGIRVVVEDEFWCPRFALWRTNTVFDVFAKLDRQSHALENFDRVARDERGGHRGAHFFDGLLYESIRGACDYLAREPSEKLEKLIDGTVDRIVAAQRADGYLHTWVQLGHADKQWGDNGGCALEQHEVYDAGALIEAGVHHYRATGKTKLLKAGVKFANLLCDTMGPSPKRNHIPTHSLAEEALVKLARLGRAEQDLSRKLGVPVRSDDYLALVKFWFDSHGRHCGAPEWERHGAHEGGGPKAMALVREMTKAKHDPAWRPCWGDYQMDRVPLADYRSIEGHAVRAALLGTGLAAYAAETGVADVSALATRFWESMTGRKMYVTGGVGARSDFERFGDDWELPPDAYLETCAAVASAFYSGWMAERTGDGRYMDEFERVIYNALLTAVGANGCTYTYQNPLNTAKGARWDWHGCPCCPSMFLKLTGALPDYVYAKDAAGLRINLFMGGTAEFECAGVRVRVAQRTRYPEDGRIAIAVDPERPASFRLAVRIPGWARGVESWSGLYRSEGARTWSLALNGEPLKPALEKGYACLDRLWRKGDVLTVDVDVSPRTIRADPRVAAVRGMHAVARGPVVMAEERGRMIPYGQIANGGPAPHRVWLNDFANDGCPSHCLGGQTPNNLNPSEPCK